MRALSVSDVYEQRINSQYLKRNSIFMKKQTFAHSNCIKIKSELGKQDKLIYVSSEHSLADSLKNKIMKLS